MDSEQRHFVINKKSFINVFAPSKVDLLLNQQLVLCFKCSVYAISRKLLSIIKGQLNAREMQDYEIHFYECTFKFA